MSEKKFRVTITDVETGEVRVEEESASVIALVGMEGRTVVVSEISGSVKMAAVLLWSMDALRDRLLGSDARLKVAYNLKEMILKKEIVVDLEALREESNE